MLRFILEIEMAFFMRYKVQFQEIEDKMTMIDLQLFIKTYDLKIKEENNNQNKNGDKVTKSLIAIRDILNYMTLGDYNNR